MQKKTLILVLLSAALLCLLLLLAFTLPEDQASVTRSPEESDPLPVSLIPDPSADTVDLADRIEPDPPVLPEIVIPTASSSVIEASDPVKVSVDEVLYAYEGMVVENNGGTVYCTGAEVSNNGGIVFCSSGTVYNNGGTVYAKAGTVISSGGKIYNDAAEIVLLQGVKDAENQIYGYYELKLADYYEPYVVLDGVVCEPGSERMIIGEDCVWRGTPRAGDRISGASSDSGELIWSEEDGSVSLINVTEDTTLRLEIEEI